jgi:hypothetical protein
MHVVFFLAGGHLMGNVIIMAVRHQDLDAVQAIDFKQVIRGYHLHDCLPKEFDGQQRWIRPQDRVYETSTPNLVVSQYHHTSGKCCFYLDDQFLVSAGVLGWTASMQDAGPAFDFESKLTQLRRTLRNTKSRILKGKVSREIRAPGTPVSLFRIFTDTMDRVENNPHLMEDVVQYCQTGEINRRTFGSLNAGIQVIGTLGGDNAYLFISAGYEGKLFTLPRFDLVITDEEREAFLGEPLAYYDPRGFEMKLLGEIAAGFGYQIISPGKISGKA